MTVTGSLLEARYTLHTFGISIDEKYLSTDDSVCCEAVEEYLAAQREKENKLKSEEAAQAAKGRVPYPLPEDVLVGRGHHYHGFEGNRAMRNIVEGYVESYTLANERLAKTVLVMNIVNKIHERGGRFLERKEDHWTPVDKQVAIRKVSQVFRTRIRDQKGDTNQQES